MSEMLLCKTHVHVHLYYIPSESQTALLDEVDLPKQGVWVKDYQKGSFYPGSSSPTTGTPYPHY